MLLKKGKVKPSVLERSVYRQLGGQTYREDLTRAPLQHVEGWTLAAERTVYGIAAAMLAAGKRECGISLDVTMPEQTREEDLKALMREIGFLSQNIKLQVNRVQARVSEHADSLLIDAGVSSGERVWCPVNFKEWKKARTMPDIVVIGNVGCEGAAMLSLEHKVKLLARYTEQFLSKAEQLMETDLKDAFHRDCTAVLEKYPVAYAQSLGEGGLFAGLWEMASNLSCGMDIALKAVPIRQHTIEICEFFALNPYQIFSSGVVLLACENGENLVRELREQGITAALIGCLTVEKDKLIRYDDEIRHLEPSKTDEYHKIQK